MVDPTQLASISSSPWPTSPYFDIDKKNISNTLTKISPPRGAGRLRAESFSMQLKLKEPISLASPDFAAP